MKDIRYLVMDVDGTLTDGKIYMGNNGEICKAFSIKDGCGLCDILTKTEIEPVILTGRKSIILEKRCEEMKVDKLYQGVLNKCEKLQEITADFSTVAYIGDDINDFLCMRLIKRAGGLVGCPADAANKILEISDFISKKNGGDGAVREFIEWIVEKGYVHKSI